MRERLAALIVAAVLVVLVVVVAVRNRQEPPRPRSIPRSMPGSTPRQLCGGRDVASAGELVVQADVWGADTAQCLQPAVNGFTVTHSEHRKPVPGEPAAFPSVFAGCAAGRCSVDRKVPAPVESPMPATAFWTPGAGLWDAVFDIWVDPSPTATHPTVELMVWVDWTEPVEPYGTWVGSLDAAGAQWDVVAGHTRQPVFTFARQSHTRDFHGDLSEFFAEAIRRGWVGRGWWVTSIQVGYELWAGGEHASVHDVQIGST